VESYFYIMMIDSLIYITLYLHLGLETDYYVYDVWHFTVL